MADVTRFGRVVKVENVFTLIQTTCFQMYDLSFRNIDGMQQYSRRSLRAKREAIGRVGLTQLVAIKLAFLDA